MDEDTERLSLELFKESTYLSKRSVLLIIAKMPVTEDRMNILSRQAKYGNTPLHLAARYSSNKRVVASLLEALDVRQRISLLSIKNKSGRTSLHLAAVYNPNSGIVVALLNTLDVGQRMELLSKQDKHGDTPMHLAAQYDNGENLVAAMLETMSAEQRMTLYVMKNEDEDVPLHLAARHNESANTTSTLLDTLSVEQKITFISMKSMGGYTPLHLAAQYNGNAEVLTTMLEAVDVELRLSFLKMETEDHWTPLHLAAKHNGSAEVTSTMFQEVDAKQRLTLLSMVNMYHDYTPLYLAVRYNENAHVVAALVDNLDAEQRIALLKYYHLCETYGETLLHSAAKNNESAHVMTTLLETLDTEQRMALLSVDDVRGNRPLHLAAKHNKNNNVIATLLDTFDTEQRITLLSMRIEFDGWITPLHFPDEAFDYEISMAVQLRERLISMKEDNQYTPLHVAAHYNGNADVMAALLKNLSTEQRITLLSMKGRCQNTPLHLAAAYNDNADVMTVLLNTLDTEQRIALLSMKGENEHTPLHLAAQYNGNTEAMNAMLGTLNTEQRCSLLSMKNANGHAPLHLMARNSDNAIVMSSLLSTLHAEQQKTVISMRVNGITPAHLAIKSRSDVLIEQLIKICEASGETIHDLLDTTDRNMLRELLDYYAHHTRRKKGMLLWQDEQGDNLLHLAATISHQDFIRKALSTQDISETNQALLMRNSKDIVPYHCTRNKDVSNLLAWAETQDDCYPLITPPRIVIFYSDEDRSSAEEERSSLMGILPLFSMVPVVKLNPTEDDVFSIIRENQDGEVSALIAVMMSHGDSGVIKVKDKQMHINKIIKQMNSTKLADIPKILILQTCQAQVLRDNHYDGEPHAKFDIDYHDSEPEQAASKLDAVPKANHAERQRQIEMKRSGNRHFDVSGPNMMVLAATINNQAAERNLMIPVLAERLRSSGKDDDLYSVFAKTHDKVRSEAPAQVPELRSTMRHKICLKKMFNKELEYKPSVQLTLPQKFRRFRDS